MIGAAACPYLREGLGPLCIARSPSFEPSQLLLDNYCQAPDYVECPFYLAAVGMRMGA